MPDTHIEIRTPRLLMRRWRESDLEPYAALNADPEVARYLAGPLTREQSDAMVERIERGFTEHGFGLWALEVAETGEFVGFTGLSVPGFEAHFTRPSRWRGASRGPRGVTATRPRRLTPR